MPRLTRTAKAAVALLCVTVFFWVMALLFQFRVANIFDKFLMKRLGPVVIFGIMTVFPVLAVVLGVKMIRSGRHSLFGRVSAGAGGLMFLALVVFIGCPMLRQAFAPSTPKNPGMPRPFKPQTGLPVFPGAEGFGTRTPAGRGGKVVEVISLADSGPGTLREALNDPDPRIVVFHIGGTIELESELVIRYPFVTVAGQTAPGGGICLKNAGIAVMSHDVLIQHIRIRPGSEGNIEPDNNDAIAILGRHGEIDGACNVVIDHVSASWSEDETVSTWYGAHDITVSWCIISEALNRSRHHKGTHSAGLLIGDGSYNVSVHHCLLAHNDFRNPLIKDGGTHDFVNNVIYDWGILPAEIVDADSNSFLNFVGDRFIPGPSTKSAGYEILINPNSGTPKIYVEGNIGPHRRDSKLSEWALVGHGWGENSLAPERYRSTEPYDVAPITKSTAEEALKKVLARAGATLPRRDAVDNRVVGEVKSRSGRIIDSPKQAGGYPKLESGTAPVDSDRDGIPDDWEKAHGLDPGNDADGPEDSDGDGYTNIEEYLHSLLK